MSTTLETSKHGASARDDIPRCEPSRDGYDSDDNGEEDMDREGAPCGASPLNVGVLIQAMVTCIEFYHQIDKGQFYAMVAEEYDKVLSMRKDLPLQVVEETEAALQRWAVKLNDVKDPHELTLPQDVEPHVDALLDFYTTVGAISKGEDTQSASSTDAPGPESPTDSIHSTAGKTDGSASHPATPNEERGDIQRSDLQDSTSFANSIPPFSNSQPTTSLISGARQSLTDPRRSRFAYRDAHTVLGGMTKEFVMSKQHLREQEELLASEKASTQARKCEFKSLKALVKQYQQRDDERRKFHALLEDDRDLDGDDMEDGESRQSNQELRKQLKKALKRCKRVQENTSLKFQLAQSENQRFEMKTEQLMAQLRNEYTDAYVFPSMALS